MYYNYSYFYFFLFVILFFFLILILLYPDYTKRDIVPPLANNNYYLNINGPITKHSTLNSVRFKDAYIQEHEGIDVDDGNAVPISFVPEFTRSNKSISGYFVLYVSKVPASTPYNLVFRVSNGSSRTGTLTTYNKGWAPLSIPLVSGTTIPVFKVVVPFNFGSLSIGSSHDIRLQIGAIGTETITRTELELNSAYVYYR